MDSPFSFFFIFLIRKCPQTFTCKWERYPRRRYACSHTCCSLCRGKRVPEKLSFSKTTTFLLKNLSILVFTGKDSDEKVDKFPCVLQFREEEVDARRDGLHSSAVFVRLVLQQQLLQIEERLLEFSLLSDLDAGSPEVFRLGTTAIIAHLHSSFFFKGFPLLISQFVKFIKNSRIRNVVD